MDAQTLINWGAGAFLTIVSWFSKEQWNTVKELRSEVRSLENELARDYVTKNDFREAYKDLKDMLVKIDEKLDRKADKD